MTYERVIQWTAGPFAMAVGVAATKLVEHLTFLGQVGLQKSAVAHGIVVVVVFGVTTLVTYAAHHKWLTNLAKWWDASGVTDPAVSEPGPSAPADTAATESAEITTLREQITNAGMTPNA